MTRADCPPLSFPCPLWLAHPPGSLLIMVTRTESALPAWWFSEREQVSSFVAVLAGIPTRSKMGTCPVYSWWVDERVKDCPVASLFLKNGKVKLLSIIATQGKEVNRSCEIEHILLLLNFPGEVLKGREKLTA